MMHSSLLALSLWKTSLIWLYRILISAFNACARLIMNMTFNVLPEFYHWNETELHFKDLSSASFHFSTLFIEAYSEARSRLFCWLYGHIFPAGCRIYITVTDWFSHVSVIVQNLLDPGTVRSLRTSVMEKQWISSLIALYFFAAVWLLTAVIYLFLSTCALYLKSQMSTSLLRDLVHLQSVRQTPCTEEQARLQISTNSFTGFRPDEKKIKARSLPTAITVDVCSPSSAQREPSLQI